MRLVAEHQAEHPTSPNVWAGTAAVVEDLGAVAPGVLQGVQRISQDAHPLRREVPLLVGAGRQLHDAAVVPGEHAFGDGRRAEGADEDVPKEAALDDTSKRGGPRQGFECEEVSVEPTAAEVTVQGARCQVSGGVFPPPACGNCAQPFNRRSAAWGSPPSGPPGPPA